MAVLAAIARIVQPDGSELRYGRAAHVPAFTSEILHGSEIPGAHAAGRIGVSATIARTVVAPFVATLGSTYQNLTIMGEMDVRVACVFINCEFVSTGPANVLVACWENVATVEFRNCTFNGTNQTDGLIKGQRLSAYRCHFRGGLKDWHGQNDVLFTECLMREHWTAQGEQHRECLLRNGGARLTVLRSYLAYEDQGIYNRYVSAALACYTSPLSDGLLVQDSYIDGGGGGYAIYAGTSTNTTDSRIIGNIFGRAISRRSGYAAPVETSFVGTPGSLISGNRWGPLGPANVAGDPAAGTLV